MYMLRSSGPFTEKKFNENDVATALARSVFPVPGGPYRRIPNKYVNKGLYSGDECTYQNAS
jgi:hypothetical protein